MPISLNDQEYYRYDRQITLRNFDIDKQLMLKQSKVLIVGVGGLGTVCSLYLCGAGVGSLTLLDFDDISITNLHRQILYSEADVGLKKAEVAKEKLKQHNSLIEIDALTQTLDSLDDTFFTHFDLIIDCTDNIQAREKINQLCFQFKKPLVSGSAIRMEGMVTLFTYQKEEPCYHCLSYLFGQESLTCIEAGVMAPLVGMIGTIQAMEAIKYLTQYGKGLNSKLLMIDAMTMEFRTLSLPKFSNCPICHES